MIINVCGVFSSTSFRWYMYSKCLPLVRLNSARVNLVTSELSITPQIELNEFALLRYLIPYFEVVVHLNDV